MSFQSITDAEWLVMESLWEKNPRTASEIIESLDGQKKWNPRTIKTLLSRLVNKNVISFTQEGRLYKYEPIVKRNEIVKKESGSFLKKIYKGSVSPMLAAFIKDSKLSQSDISELRDLLDKKEREMED